MGRAHGGHRNTLSQGWWPTRCGRMRLWNGRPERGSEGAGGAGGGGSGHAQSDTDGQRVVDYGTDAATRSEDEQGARAGAWAEDDQDGGDQGAQDSHASENSERAPRRKEALSRVFKGIMSEKLQNKERLSPKAVGMASRGGQIMVVPRQ